MSTVFVPCLIRGQKSPDFSQVTYETGNVIDGWQVVKTIPYKSAQLGCEPLTLAFLAQDEVPEESTWDCYQFPCHGIQVELSEVDQSSLGFSFLYSDDLPQLNVNVPAGFIAAEGSDGGEGSLMQRVPSDWVTERFVTYLPQAPSPIPTIYLVWCKQLALLAA